MARFSALPGWDLGRVALRSTRERLATTWDRGRTGAPAMADPERHALARGDGAGRVVATPPVLAAPRPQVLEIPTRDLRGRRRDDPSVA